MSSGAIVRGLCDQTGHRFDISKGPLIRSVVTILQNMTARSARHELDGSLLQKFPFRNL